ncbi:glycosyltransferase family 1 protein [Spirochaeta cellobiosiphila]|uniref:glycosyltransferase family 1 protein n=1 Tax=Spirochaeta cellobiosiphila TaxID=504483 RepID=UPI0003FA4B7F|nr:glycosyltransferase family 1 protein [Spirochaeta cellobiosiphila]
MNIPIRILHVLGRLDRGGAETLIMNIYRNINRDLIQFDFIVHTEDNCEYTSEINSLGGRIYSIQKYRGINHFEYKKAWTSFLEKHSEYRIIHGHIRSTASIYLKIAKKLGCATIAHSHNTSSGSGLNAIVKNVLQLPIRFFADYLFACSIDAGKWLFGNKAIKENRFKVITNGIELKKYSFNPIIREKKRNELGISTQYVIGHIGRFHPQKNHFFLLKLMFELLKKSKDISMVLVGDGQTRQEIEKISQRMGMKDNIIFAGVRSDIPELLQSFDLFILPSLFEGLGIVAIEAQASGLPCLVSEGIPNEAFVTNNIAKLSLKDPIKLWINWILSHLEYYREDKIDVIDGKGYNIIETASYLQNFYLQLNKKMMKN